jgi:NAD(P)-dependent dehydrogenase (short-subunit alcohol dehydrogenase family)
VLVTGAASGIGRATALRFAARGATRIACLDIHDAGNQDTAGLVTAAGAEALAIHVDLGSVASIRAAYAEALAALGRIDAAAHVGGYSWRGETVDVTEEQWDMVINVNLRGTFFCCQEALRAMYAQGSGAIVNMSADAAFFPIYGFAVQAAGKGGIALMTQTLALETARRGVRVNCVSPGITKVAPTGSARPPSPNLKRDDLPVPPPADAMPEQTAGGRWMQAEETADAIVYLASDAASGVNGTLLHVNGGGYLTLNY